MPNFSHRKRVGTRHMPGIFDSSGIRFQYPDSWRLEESDESDEGHTVSVESPGGSFWSVTRCEADADRESLAKAALKAIQETYPAVDVDQVSEEIAGHELVGYDACFFQFDLTNTAQIRTVRAHHAIWLIYCQGEDREFDSLLPVFQAMTLSLLQDGPKRKLRG